MFFAAFVASLSLFPTFSAAEPRHLPILQSGRRLSPQDHFAAAERTKARYGSSPALSRDKQRRGTSEEIDITNESTDQYYYIEISIGTPAQTFKVMVDSSSSDLWVGGTTCSSGCPSSVSLYDHTKSSTAVNGTTSITTTYGAGSVQGDVFTDIIRMGTYSVSQTGFGAYFQPVRGAQVPTMDPVVATKVSDSLIASPISGIIGFAFSGLAKAGTPFWQAVTASGQAAAPEMGFWLSRVLGTSNPKSEEPGGVFTFGGVNASLYSGDIDFRDLTGTTSTFWTLDLSAITVQGKAIAVTSSTKLAVFDTATTVIAGPPDDVKAIWAAVPGSSPSTVQNGFYQFPCDTNVNVSVSFGGRIWRISSVDMNIATLSANLCLGGIFALTPASSSSPAWIFGATFLKNVYTVFRQNPASVGFAELSTLAGGTGTPSSQSSGSASAPVSGSSSTSSIHSQNPGNPQDTPSGSPKKKSNTGIIIGGVVGGLGVIGLVVAFFIFRRRRQKTTRTEEKQHSSNLQSTPFSLVVDDPTKLDQSAGSPAHGLPTSPVAAQTQLSPVRRSHGTSTASASNDASLSSSTPPTLMSMKRAQAAAMPRYGDTHTAPDSVTRTDTGLQLTPGRPAGAQAPSSPAATTPDPVLQELQSLREEVRRLVAERHSEAPPSYDHHGD
ncbi:Acid protease [Mycena venus]|uniref:Acid protease n=1 Tax=Mycena venus TaxID=2733690 RepID=A0A8H6YH64_9AGAR|nr:Acid protease [Mycena venus]